MLVRNKATIEEPPATRQRKTPQHWRERYATLTWPAEGSGHESRRHNVRKNIREKAHCPQKAKRKHGLQREEPGLSQEGGRKVSSCPGEQDGVE